MEKSKLLELRNIIEDIKKNGVKDEYLIAMDILMNDNHIPLVFNKFGLSTAAFNPNYKLISVNVKNIMSWLDEMSKTYTGNFQINDLELLKAYLVVYMYRHEIEHTNQYCIAYGLKKPNYDYKQQVFHDVMSVLISKDYIIPRPITFVVDTARFILYKRNAYNYILERNASVEGYDLASLIAYNAGDKEMFDCMIDSRNIMMMQGYMENGNGTLLETYQGMKMMSKYRKLGIPDDIPLVEKVREGLTISEDERKLVLDSFKKKAHFKQ